MNRLRLIAIKNSYIPNQPYESFAQGLKNRSNDVQEVALKAFLHNSIVFPASSTDRLHAMLDDVNLVNHSCKPNAERYWNALEQKVELRAAVEIAGGEEITISYFNPFQAREKRRSDLRLECKCSAYSLNGSDMSTFEQRVQILEKAFATLEKFQTQYLISDLRYGRFERFGEELAATVANDPRSDEVLLAARKTIAVVSEKFGINNIKLADS